MHGPCDSANSSEESSSTMAFLAVESQATSHHSCRVCWDASHPSTLVSPCSCKGTQKYVHVKCLRRWQENVQKRDFRDERAYRCGVCQTPYSLAPPDPRWTAKVGHALRALGGAACITLLAFGLAGPPWPHLALVVLVLLGTRTHGMLAMGLLAAGTVAAALHAKGLRLLMRVDDAGRLGLAVVRHGAPVPGLGPGTLLVASDDLDHSIFRRSVVLIYEHGPAGARGVILNQPLSSEAALGAGWDGSGGGENGTAAEPAGKHGSGGGGGGGGGVAHRLGGPVGMPGEGARQEIAVLHTMGGVEGASVVLWEPGQAPRGAPALFQGGRLADVLAAASLRRAAAAAAEKKKRTRRGGGGGGARPGDDADDGAGGGAAPSVLVFHGVATWAEGQLEGEIRARAWAFGDAGVGDVLRGATEEMWEALARSDRVAMIA